MWLLRPAKVLPHKHRDACRCRLEPLGAKGACAVARSLSHVFDQKLWRITYSDMFWRLHFAYVLFGRISISPMALDNDPDWPSESRWTSSVNTVTSDPWTHGPIDSLCGVSIHLTQLLDCQISNCQDMAVGECWCHQPLWHHSWSQWNTQQPARARPLAHKGGAPLVAQRASEAPRMLAQIRAATVLHGGYALCPAHPRILGNSALVACPTL